jgi:hypothetical protein
MAVMFAASISVSGRSHRIVLRNLSARGGCIEGQQLPKGTNILLTRNGETGPCRVTWVDQDRCGLEFSNAAQGAAALRKIAHRSPRPRPATGRPGLKCKPLTHAEELAMDGWAVRSPLAIGD